MLLMNFTYHFKCLLIIAILIVTFISCDNYMYDNLTYPSYNTLYIYHNSSSIYRHIGKHNQPYYYQSTQHRVFNPHNGNYRNFRH